MIKFDSKLTIMKIKKINFYIFLVLLASIFAISSCEKVLNATFTKSYTNIRFELDSTSETGNVTFAGENVNTDISNFAAQNNFNLNRIKSAKIKICNINILDSSISNPVTFGMIDYVSAKLTGVGLDTLEIGSRNITAGSNLTSITLDLMNVDVLPYIKADSFNYIISGSTNAPIPHKVPMSANLSFEIVAGL